jgi:hypothetical protein
MKPPHPATLISEEHKLHRPVRVDRRLLRYGRRIDHHRSSLRVRVPLSVTDLISGGKQLDMHLPGALVGWYFVAHDFGSNPSGASALTTCG